MWSEFKYILGLTCCILWREVLLWQFYSTNSRYSINVSRRRSAGFHRWVKVFSWISLWEKLSSRWSNQAGKMILTAGQFARCPALNETPECVPGSHGNLLGFFLFRHRRFGSLVLVSHFNPSQVSHKGHNLSCGLITSTALDQWAISLQYKIGVLQEFKNEIWVKCWIKGNHFSP